MPTLEHLKNLIARPSISPDDAGCMDYITKQLEKIGFECTRLDDKPVSNLWAIFGTEGPLVVFAGHTDVVAPGEETKWEHPPFALTEHDGFLYGRGTQDMKGSLACMISACERFVSASPNFTGRIAFLLTSGEEGEDYLHGTPHVLKYLDQNGIDIDYCIVGEPSCTAKLGDTVRIGRRGSLHGHLTVKGIQGHVAYPDDADNAIHRALDALSSLRDTVWDEGHDRFPTSSLQISNISSGTGALNVIPGELKADFNFRYNPNLTHLMIQSKTESLFDAENIEYDLQWVLSGEPFLTEPGTLIEALEAAVEKETGLGPKLCTGGGTSDARFIATTGCEVVEFGLVNDRIHQINERTTQADLNMLTNIYYQTLSHLLG